MVRKRMKSAAVYRILNTGIALVWGINGLVCKVFNLVPRHQQIVGRILGIEYQKPLTTAIGIAETLMCLWILTGYRSKLNAILQIFVVLVMNVLEFRLVPDLLLWGHLNLVFAFVFAGLVYLNAFYINPKKAD